jgi:uncharacterized damage-inducible protein DinB
LSHIVCQNFDSLRAERIAEDERLVRIISSVPPGDFGKELGYISMDGKPQRLPRRLILSHLFLHHAHQRGQIHALFSQTPIVPPALDITYFPLG